MPFMMKLTMAAALLAVTNAAPTAEKEGFSVTLVPKGKGVIKSGPAAHLAAFRKFGATPPSGLVAAAAATGTVTASPEEFDEEYLAPVVVGGQTLNIDIDTGSSDFWVFSSELPTSEQSGHSIFNPAKSTTAKVQTGETWSIEYGDGSSASGNVYSDTVSLGSTTVTGQIVELAEKISAEFTEDTDSDGIMGLAFNNINQVEPTAAKTFISNAIAQSLPSPLFTANLKKGVAGNYNFGFIDTTEFTGAITTVPVTTSQGFWEFTAGGWAIGSAAVTTSSFSAIADTGTTLFYLPAAAVTAYYKQVSGATNSASEGGWIFPCSATLPSFTAVIGGAKFVVPGTYINYAPVTSTTCFGGIQSDAGIGFSIFGDIFLKSQFVVFTMASSPTIGFAAKPV